jgi:O-acetyl-ADP-ribose deacetylase (regulator of RNase III)
VEAAAHEVTCIAVFGVSAGVCGRPLALAIWIAISAGAVVPGQAGQLQAVILHCFGEIDLVVN